MNFWIKHGNLPQRGTQKKLDRQKKFGTSTENCPPNEVTFPTTFRNNRPQNSAIEAAPRLLTRKYL